MNNVRKNIDTEMKMQKIHDYMLVVCLKRGYVKWYEVAHFFGIQFNESVDRKFRTYRKIMNQKLREQNAPYRFLKKIDGKMNERGIQIVSPEAYEKAMEIEGKKAFSEKGKEKRAGGKGQQILNIG